MFDLRLIEFLHFFFDQCQVFDESVVFILVFYFNLGGNELRIDEDFYFPSTWVLGKVKFGCRALYSAMLFDIMKDII